MKKEPAGKHFQAKRRVNRKKIIVVVVLFMLLVFAFFTLFIPKNKGNLQNDDIDNFTNVSDYKSNDIKNETIEKKIVDVDMPEKIENYNVLGQIVVKKANIKRYILDKTNNYSLNLSVTKFYGADLNEIGNCCITGHNMEGHFKGLKHLSIGDTFYIIDKENKEKVIYEIYDMYTVFPTELDCLSQETNNRREVTLITCNPRGSN